MDLRQESSRSSSTCSLLDIVSEALDSDTLLMSSTTSDDQESVIDLLAASVSTEVIEDVDGSDIRISGADGEGSAESNEDEEEESSSLVRGVPETERSDVDRAETPPGEPPANSTSGKAELLSLPAGRFKEPFNIRKKVDPTMTASSNEKVRNSIDDHEAFCNNKPIRNADGRQNDNLQADKGSSKNCTETSLEDVTPKRTSNKSRESREVGPQDAGPPITSYDKSEAARQNQASKGRRSEYVDDHGGKETRPSGDESPSDVERGSPNAKPGRVIMIDGIKFVAITCLRPPRGNCRTCAEFGSLLYFSARSAYIQEAAEKFCSVLCARKFIKDKLANKMPSRQTKIEKVGFDSAFPKVTVSQGKHNLTNNLQQRATSQLGEKTAKKSQDRTKRSKYRLDPAAIEKLRELCSIYQTGVQVQQKNTASLKQKEEIGIRGNKKDVGRCSSATPSHRRQSESRQPKTSKSATSFSLISSVGGLPSINIESGNSQKILKNPKDCRDMSKGNSGNGTSKNVTSISTKTANHETSELTKDKMKNVKRRAKSLDVYTTDSVICKDTNKKEKSYVGQQEPEVSEYRCPKISPTVWKRDKQIKRSGLPNKTHSRSLSLNETAVKRFPGEKITTPRKKLPGSQTLDRSLKQSLVTPNEKTEKNNKSYGGEPLQSRLGGHTKCSTPALRETPKKSDKKSDTKPLGPSSTRKNDVLTPNTKSLNKFHEQMRSRFKTMFPFQHSTLLGDGTHKTPKGDCKEDTPSRVSVINESSGDLPVMCTESRDQRSNGPLDSRAIQGGSTHLVIESGRKTKGTSCRNKGMRSSRRVRKSSSGSSNWTSLLQLMIEAADREELERRAKKGEKGAAACQENSQPETETGIIASVNCTEMEGYGGTGECRYDGPKCRGMDETVNSIQKPAENDPDGDKKSKKRKKKRKRRKRKGKANNDQHDRGQSEVAASSAEFLHPSGHKSKKKKKRKRSKRKRKHECQVPPQQTPSVPPDSPICPNPQDVDPDAWPKWIGDGKAKSTDMMTDIDMLLWTMSNDFQPVWVVAVETG